MTKYRRATLDDLDELHALCKDHFREARMEERGYSYDEESSYNSLQQLITADHIWFTVGVDSLGIVSLACFNITQSKFNAKESQLVEVMWYGRTNRDMIEIFNECLSVVGDDLTVHIGTPCEKIGKFLKKRGFVLTGYTYMKHNTNSGGE